MNVTKSFYELIEYSERMCYVSYGLRQKVKVNPQMWDQSFGTYEVEGEFRDHARRSSGEIGVVGYRKRSQKECDSVGHFNRVPTERVCFILFTRTYLKSQEIFGWVQGY